MVCIQTRTSAGHLDCR
uniref:Uncharacterized protein n=1 Tax=Moniliophthora roreri TaxID=221103 RepID=A0A0W0FYP7_MONRR